MSFGFRLVQLVALGIYGVAVVAFFRLQARSNVAVLDPVGS